MFQVGEELSVCRETASKTVTLNTVCSRSETFTGQNFTASTAKTPIDTIDKKSVGSQEVSESQHIDNDCDDAPDNVNKSDFPLHLTPPSSCLFTQSISFKHEDIKSNVLDMNLQKCDTEGRVISSSSYVYNQKTEISKTELFEETKLSQEISSFYDNDISNSSTV